MRRLLVLTLGVGLAMLMIGVGAWIAGATNTRAAQRASLRQQSDHQVQLVEHYVARASSVILVAASNPAFAQFYALPDTRYDKVVGGGTVTEQVNDALQYLEQLYSDRIGEA